MNHLKARQYDKDRPSFYSLIAETAVWALWFLAMFSIVGYAAAGVELWAAIGHVFS